MTTAVEATWRLDVPVLFLGEWCRRYDRRQVWEGMDAEVMAYHWDDRQKLHSDYQNLQDLHESLLQELADELNYLHGVQNSVRYWRILLGPWLGYFVQMLFDRWFMLRAALSSKRISGVRVMVRAPGSSIANDMGDFERLLSNDEWNEAVCGELLLAMGAPIEWISGGEGLRRPELVPVRPSLRSRLIDLVGKALVKAGKGSEYFFISTYLPRGQNLRIQCQLGQIPRYWRQVPVPVADPDISSRQNFRLEDPKDFWQVARMMVRRHMPIVYKEGFHRLRQTLHALPWPRKPKAIFTSNSWASDDVFKAWAAGQVENGVPLVIGQHGGNYGMARWNFGEEHQIAISDQYLTWGWSKAGKRNVIPVYNFRGFGSDRPRRSANIALMVTTTLPRMSYQMFSAPVASQWLSYFEDQCRFVQALPPRLRKQIKIRMHAQDYGWCQKQRWSDRFPEIDLDDGTSAMTNLIACARLYISTYNATTYLESLSRNIPTLIFWSPEHWELREDVLCAFDQLKAAGIFHETPEGAAEHMAAIWENVDGWWMSEETQSARRKFCETFARTPEKPVEVMSSVLGSLQ